MYVIDTTCFDECFLFHVIAGRRFVVTLRFFQPPYCRFLWNKCFERSPYFTHLHNNCSTDANAKFKKKLSYTILIQTWKTSRLFYDNVFYTLYFVNCSTLVFIKLFFFFLKNSKHIWKVSGQLPLKENCPPVRIGVWIKVRVSFRVGGQPDTRKIVPQLGLGFGLRLVLWLGDNWKNFCKAFLFIKGEFFIYSENKITYQNYIAWWRIF